jgi:hypothetical protein
VVEGIDPKARQSVDFERKVDSRNSSKCLRWPSFMMSYTMPCTCLWSSASTLMRRTSPWTRIIGGNPADRCKSDALFLTLKASSWVMSTESSLARVDVCYAWEIMTMIADNLQRIQSRMAAGL